MLKKLYLIALSFGLALSLTSQASFAKPNLSDLLAKAETLQGAFSQKVITSNGRVIQQSTGLVAIEKPGKFLWLTEAPFEQKILALKDTLWVFDLDLDQVSIYDINQAVGQTPALMLTDATVDIDAEFVVNHQAKLDKVDIFRLEPKQSAEERMFDWLEMHFVDEVVALMVIADQFGQTTYIEFSDMVSNEPIDDKRFAKDVPDGSDVIDNRS